MLRTSKLATKVAASLVCVGVFLGVASAAQAGVIAFGFSGGLPNSDQNFTYGFKFTPQTNIVVDSLGFYDAGSDGLASGHRVGIWTAGGVLLASTTVTTGNSTLSGPVVNGGQFRFTTIPDFALSASTTYVLGGAIEGAPDIWYAAGTNISTAPSLVSVSPTGEFVSGNFVFPSGNFGNRYAPVSFTVRAIPESTTLAIFGLGLAGLGVMRRRRRIA